MENRVINTLNIKKMYKKIALISVFLFLGASCLLAQKRVVIGSKKLQVQNVSEIQNLKLTIGDQIKVTSNNSDYVVQVDSIAGYATDSLVVIPVSAGYAVYMGLLSNIAEVKLSDLGVGNNDNPTNLIEKLSSIDKIKIHFPPDTLQIIDVDIYDNDYIEFYFDGTTIVPPQGEIINIIDDSLHVFSINNANEIYVHGNVKFDFRQVSGKYEGAVVRLRRASDNAERDFKANELLNDAETWSGGGDAYVVKIYDQTKGGNHMELVTLSDNYIIIQSGSLQTINSNPVMLLSASGSSFIIPEIEGNSNISTFLVRDTNDSAFITYSGQDVNKASFVAHSGSGASSNGLNYGSPTLYKNNTLYAGTTRGELQTFLTYGQLIESHLNADVSTWTIFRLGRYGSIFNFDLHFQELIVYSSDQSSDREAIVNTINEHYNIF
jgi:hypothetical protein